MFKQNLSLLSPIIQDLRLNTVKPFIKEGKILDIGCGDGKLATMLSKKCSYHGIEKNKKIASDLKEALSKKTNLKFLNIWNKNIEKGNFRNLDVKFDTIVLAAILEHLNEPIKVVVELAHLLNKNGSIIITTPTNFGMKLHKYLSLIWLTSKDAAKEHTQALGKNEFQKMEKECGLKLTYYRKFMLGCNQIVIYNRW